MAENSKIEWTTHTFNPWIGCQKVGPGCDHCYAETWDARSLQQREGRWGPHANRTRTSPANWRKPLAWDRAARDAGQRARVFCASLADVFDNHGTVDPQWRRDLWALIASTPNLDWMLLTKRPGNIDTMLPHGWGDGWPNVWLGCTVVNQAEADRDIPKLLAVPARVRFLSMEPLLGPVDLTLDSVVCLPCQYCQDAGPDWETGVVECPRCDATGKGDEWGIDLVIVGGESGPNARPMHPDWARSLRDQCVAAGVAFHFKQWGEWVPVVTDLVDKGQLVCFEDGCGDLACFAKSRFRAQVTTISRQEMWCVGKHHAGRLLDGRTWDQMPGAAQ